MKDDLQCSSMMQEDIQTARVAVPVDRLRMRTFAVAFGAVAVATVASLPLKDIAVHSRGMLLFASIMFSAWYGGLWSGVFSSALAAISFRCVLESNSPRLAVVPAMIRAFVFLGVAVFVSYLNEKRRVALAESVRQGELLKSAMDEIKVLRGIVPICMHCKQIRSSAGLWQQVERYISEHTDARFSHGVCPGCMAAKYPEEAAAIEARRRVAEAGQ